MNKKPLPPSAPKCFSRCAQCGFCQTEASVGVCIHVWGRSWTPSHFVGPDLTIRLNQHQKYLVLLGPRQPGPGFDKYLTAASASQRAPCQLERGLGTDRAPEPASCLPSDPWKGLQSLKKCLSQRGHKKSASVEDSSLHGCHLLRMPSL